MHQEQKEQLPASEQLSQATEPQAQTLEGLNAGQVEQLYTARQADLEALKQWVSLKFYYRVAEKVKAEQTAFRRLLRLEDAKQNILSEYSFVLDSAYFEQKFLS